MREVFANLYCGNEEDFYRRLLCMERPPHTEMELLSCMPVGWAVVHAAKEPFHRMALGYTGRGAPKDHPDYLWSERLGGRLVLNMVDAPKPEFFDKDMIDKALDFIENKLKEGHKVLVHCNEGMSRAPSLCLLYLMRIGAIKGTSLQEYEAGFRELYPEYEPAAGIWGFVQTHWSEYRRKQAPIGRPRVKD